MSEQNQEQQTDQKAELALLKQRADLMGISYSNAIGVDALKKKIADKQEGNEQQDTNQNGGSPDEEQANPLVQQGVEPSNEKIVKKNLRQLIHEKHMRMVRIRITCLDPKKANLPGEIITVANDVIGTVKKYVPYGEVTDEGYHVPYCIFNMLDKRKFLNIRTKRNTRTGVDEPVTNYAKEFSIEVLPPLTEEELKRLAVAQMAAGVIEPLDQ